jgi:hypothetical protein
MPAIANTVAAVNGIKQFRNDMPLLLDLGDGPENAVRGGNGPDQIFLL